MESKARREKLIRKEICMAPHKRFLTDFKLASANVAKQVRVDGVT